MFLPLLYWIHINLTMQKAMLAPLKASCSVGGDSALGGDPLLLCVALLPTYPEELTPWVAFDAECSKIYQLLLHYRTSP